MVGDDGGEVGDDEPSVLRTMIERLEIAVAATNVDGHEHLHDLLSQALAEAESLLRSMAPPEMH